MKHEPEECPMIRAIAPKNTPCPPMYAAKLIITGILMGRALMLLSSMGIYGADEVIGHYLLHIDEDVAKASDNVAHSCIELVGILEAMQRDREKMN